MAAGSADGEDMQFSRIETMHGEALPEEAIKQIDSERRTVRALLQRRNAMDVRTMVVDAYARLDQNIQKAIQESGIPVACSKGCSLCCCGIKVDVLVPEALVIADRLRDDSTSEVRQQVEAAAVKRRNMSWDAQLISGDPCPFLDSAGECMVYDLRPMNCRQYYCLDARECEYSAAHPEVDPPVSMHIPTLMVGKMASLALLAAIKDVGLDGRPFELATAVATALRSDTTQRWLAGESVFSAAVRPVDVKERAPQEVQFHGRIHSVWKSRSKKNRNK